MLWPEAPTVAGEPGGSAPNKLIIDNVVTHPPRALTRGSISIAIYWFDVSIHCCELSEANTRVRTL